MVSILGLSLELFLLCVKPNSLCCVPNASCNRSYREFGGLNLTVSRHCRLCFPQVLQAQEDAVQSVLKEARDALLAISGNKKQYQALLTDLLVRASCPPLYRLRAWLCLDTACP